MLRKVFDTLDEFNEYVEWYFKKCDPHVEEVVSLEEKDWELEYVVKKEVTKPKPYTMSGLAVHLGISRKELKTMENVADEYKEVIKMAIARCEQFSEEKLYDNKNTSGVVFAMTNNFEEWSNKSSSDITTKGDKVNLTDLFLASQVKSDAGTTEEITDTAEQPEQSEQPVWDWNIQEATE